MRKPPPRHPQARTTADFDELLADPELDAVVIATPVITAFRARQAVLSTAGKHVFVEKPQAQTTAEAEELFALAQERGLVLMPGYLLLYHPAHRQAERAGSTKGSWGTSSTCTGCRETWGQIRRDENALWSLGAHDLSVILHLIGEEPVEAWARGRVVPRTGIEDVVFCFLRFPSGVVAHMHVSWLDPHKMRRLTVVGSDKMAVFDDMEPERKVTVYDKGPVRRPATEWQVREGDINILVSRTRRAVAARVRALPGRLFPARVIRSKPNRQGVAVVKTLELLQELLETAAV